MRGVTFATVLGLSGLGVPGATAQVLTSHNVEHVGNHGDLFVGTHGVVQGDRYYLGSLPVGLRIYDVSDPAVPRLIGDYSPIYEGDRPRADALPDAAELDGRHIAVLNGTARPSHHFPPDFRADRTEFLDVTDPERPVVLWTFVGADDGEAQNGDIVDERRLWIPSGAHMHNGLRIYDLGPLLRDPPAAPANLVRADPVALWEASPYRRGREVGPAFTHTHDVTVSLDHEVAGLGKRDILLLAEAGELTSYDDSGSVFVIDITEPRAPVVLLRWRHTAAPGHDPTAYYHEAQFLKGGRPNVVLVADEDLTSRCSGGVTALQLTPDLTDAAELSEWFVEPQVPITAVCTVHVFDSKDGLAYFGAYNAGLQIVDYGDPASPVEVGHAILFGTTAWGATLNDGFVYVGDLTRGLDVFRYTASTPPPPPQDPPDAGFQPDAAVTDAGDDGRGVVRGGGCAVGAGGGSGGPLLLVVLALGAAALLRRARAR